MTRCEQMEAPVKKAIAGIDRCLRIELNSKILG